MQQLESYRNHLVNRIYKLLPLKEQNCETLLSYYDSLIFELLGVNKLLNHNQKLVTIIGLLESLKDEGDFKQYRKYVFQSISLTESLFKETGEEYARTL